MTARTATTSVQTASRPSSADIVRMEVTIENSLRCDDLLIVIHHVTGHY